MNMIVRKISFHKTMKEIIGLKNLLLIIYNDRSGLNSQSITKIDGDG